MQMVRRYKCVLAPRAARADPRMLQQRFTPLRR
jgi:hypothetical protein